MWEIWKPQKKIELIKNYFIFGYPTYYFFIPLKQWITLLNYFIKRLVDITDGHTRLTQSNKVGKYDRCKASLIECGFNQKRKLVALLRSLSLSD